MTCIVSVQEKGIIYMGGDSAGVAGLSITIRSDVKVFQNHEFLIGFAGSFRMGQLLHYRFVPPPQPVGVDDMRYMVTDFIDGVRKCFFDNGYGSKERNEGGSFLVGYKGRLYTIDRDFQVGIPTDQMYAIGSGQEISLGALYATKKMKPEARLKLALEAAAHHNAGVIAPFIFMKSK